MPEVARIVVVAPDINTARGLAEKSTPPLPGKEAAPERPPVHPWRNNDAHDFEMLDGEGEPRVVAIEQPGVRVSLGLPQH